MDAALNFTSCKSEWDSETSMQDSEKPEQDLYTTPSPRRFPACRGGCRVMTAARSGVSRAHTRPELVPPPQPGKPGPARDEAPWQL